jgi:hypothetical protein
MLQELSLQEIQSLAPQAFATAPSDKTSEKYSFLPTTRIMEDMKQLGWLVCNAKSMKSSGKNPLRGTHGKHIIQFFNPDVCLKKEDGSIEAFPQIVIENNAAGWGRLKIEVGIFRLVCENGLIIKSMDFGSFKMRHLGYTFEDLQTLVNDIVERLPIAVEKINVFTGTEMTPIQQKEFATKAIKARLGEDRVCTDDEINQVLQSRRDADNGNNLWVIFNRVQEALIRGGGSFVDSKGKLRTMRPIKNMIQDMTLNKDIWEIAEEYVG